jgi:hypothetical protein
MSSLFSFSCGKKGPPLVAQQDFTIMVKDLQGEWRNDAFQLAGAITGMKSPENLPDMVKTCRVYYGKYSLSDPPCDECPVNFHGFYDLEPDDFMDKDKFKCTIPINKEPGIYYFEVRLVSTGGALGPPSNRIKKRIGE